MPIILGGGSGVVCLSWGMMEKALDGKKVRVMVTWAGKAIWTRQQSEARWTVGQGPWFHARRG